MVAAAAEEEEEEEDAAAAAAGGGAGGGAGATKPAPAAKPAPVAKPPPAAAASSSVAKPPPGFPAGCTSECYLDNNPELTQLPELDGEESILHQYLKFGAKAGLDCRCREGGEAKGSATAAAVDSAGEEEGAGEDGVGGGGTVRDSEGEDDEDFEILQVYDGDGRPILGDEDDVVSQIRDVADKIEELEEEGDDAALAEAADLKALEGELKAEEVTQEISESIGEALAEEVDGIDAQIEAMGDDVASAGQNEKLEEVEEELMAKSLQDELDAVEGAEASLRGGDEDPVVAAEKQALEDVEADIRTEIDQEAEEADVIAKMEGAQEAIAALEGEGGEEVEAEKEALIDQEEDFMLQAIEEDVDLGLQTQEEALENVKQQLKDVDLGVGPEAEEQKEVLQKLEADLEVIAKEEEEDDDVRDDETDDDVFDKLDEVEAELSELEGRNGTDVEAAKEALEAEEEQLLVEAIEEDEDLIDDPSVLDEVEYELEDLQAQDGSNVEEAKEVLEELEAELDREEGDEVFGEIDEVEEELEDLEGMEGSPEVEAEKIELEAKEEGLLAEAIAKDEEDLKEEEGSGGMSPKELEDELLQIEEQIEELDEVDDDSVTDSIYELEDLADDLEDQLDEEIFLEDEIDELNETLNELLEDTSGKNASSLVESIPADAIDPALTMDLTTMNAPGMEANIASNASALASTKEAVSEPLKMDAEPDRDSGGDAPSAAAETEGKPGGEEDLAGSEPERTVDATVAPAATEATVPPTEADEEDEDDDATPSPTKAASSPPPTPSPEGETSAPGQGEGGDASSPSYSPTVAYVKPSDELDPLANETGSKEAFEDGETVPPPGEEDEETPSSAEGADDDDEEEGPSSAEEEMEELFREGEEEAKKVGGWLTLASIVLMIYTAYQMSENPDGICASLCRLVITVVGCILKIMLIPFKYIMGGGRPSGGHYMATPDYRDPYGSRHMELT